MPKGRKWTADDIELLAQCVKNKLSYKEIQANYFADRTVNAIEQARRKHFDDADYSRSKPWTTKEIKALRQILEQHRYSRWSDIARQMPNRSAAACKQCAEKHLTPPDGRKYFLQRDGHLVRKHGPIKPWAAELSKTIRKAYAKSDLTKADIAKMTGASRLTFEHLIEGRRIPRMPIYVAFCEVLGVDAGIALSEAIRAAKGKVRGGGGYHARHSD